MGVTIHSIYRSHNMRETAGASSGFDRSRIGRL